MVLIVKSLVLSFVWGRKRVKAKAATPRAKRRFMMGHSGERGLMR
jgi:hypothetical protein